MTAVLGEAPTPADTSRPTRRDGSPTPQPLHVVVVSESPVVRLGVAAMLASYEERVRATLHPWAPGGRPPAADVTLVDSGGCACAAVEVARRRGSGKVLLYGRDLPPRQVELGLARGCAAHVDLRASAAELLTAIETVGLPHRRRAGGRRWPGGEHGLSRRESDVLALISVGLTNEAIAERAGLSPNTVKSYIRSAYRKVGVSRRSEAVRWGVEHGLASAQAPAVHR
jgi:DNA-binding CsgD family transcriptional regulator